MSQPQHDSKHRQTLLRKATCPCGAQFVAHVESQQAICDLCIANIEQLSTEIESK